MCDHTEEDTINYGWVCSRCNHALSPFTELCPICNGAEEDQTSGFLLKDNEMIQDRILKDDAIFKNLIGN